MDRNKSAKSVASKYAMREKEAAPSRDKLLLQRILDTTVDVDMLIRTRKLSRHSEKLIAEYLSVAGAMADSVAADLGFELDY